MVGRGAFEGMPVELIDGFLVEVSPQGPKHGAMVQALTGWFAVRADVLRVQLPLAADALSEPEPDVALAELPDPRDHPSTAWLVVEVAVSSQRQDEHKAGVYARAQVPAYWRIDVPARTVTVFSNPSPEGYRNRADLRGDDLLEPLLGIEPATVAELFGRARLA